MSKQLKKEQVVGMFIIKALRTRVRATARSRGRNGWNSNEPAAENALNNVTGHELDDTTRRFLAPGLASVWRGFEVMTTTWDH